MDYFRAEDVGDVAKSVVKALGWNHIDLSHTHFVRSKGSKSHRVLARIHGLPRAVQLALRISPSYVIEVIGEKFDKLPIDEKEKTIIHELLHIPKGFGGGLSPHKGRITSRHIDKLYKMYQKEMR